MIIDLIITAFGYFLQAIFYYLPIVTLSSLPYIGDTIASLLLTVVKTWNSFLVTFPYAVVGWNIFKYVILPFEGLLLLSKFLLGSRSLGQHK